MILLTLLLQGLKLPYLIIKLKVADPDQTTTVEAQGRTLQKELSGQASQYMKDKYGEQLETNPVLQKLLLD